MSDTLKKICDNRREQVAKLKRETSFEEIHRLAKAAPPVNRLGAALRAKVAQGDIGLICEIKKASPSAGLIRKNFDPAALARAYEKGGAAALSVLTEETYFQGSNATLQQAKTACSLPVLRKDFIVDLWQIAESRALGADCVLLIMAALDEGLARELHAAATAYGMNVLLEAHDRAEMECALRFPNGLIGINNRNLKTLKVDLSTTEHLAPMVPEGREIVSESGIHTKADIDRLRNVGVHRFLIGESLMRQEDVAAATQALI